MAEGCTESSIATSSAIPNWWPDLHASSLSSWSSNTNPWQPSNPNSNSSGDEDVSISTSFTNASSQSGLSAESSRHLVESPSANELFGQTTSDNQLWSQVLLSVGRSGELDNSQEVGENSINMLSSKSLSTAMFEPACDYLKKMDNSWEFTNQPSLNNFEKHFNGFNENLIESQRLTKFSNLVSNWSIAPPESEINHQFDPRACHMNSNISLSPTIDRPSQPDFFQMKQPLSHPMSCGGRIHRNSDSFSCYGHELKGKNENRDIGTPGALFQQSFNSNGIDYQIGLNNSIVGDNSKYYYGMPNVPCTSTRSYADATSFNSFLSKPSLDIHPSKLVLRSLNLSDSKKLGIQASSPPTISTCQTVTRSNMRGQGITCEGKRKRSEENSGTALKKPKNDSSTVSSSAKVQVSKVKITEKITALQQIVSPFGKTDTASVLWEAIGYIKFLQEQVQLLSNPYMKTNANKDPWGVLDRKDRGDLTLDLKSRGLCLVPISCTPQVYRENTGSDYWTPTYRGCLYR